MNCWTLLRSLMDHRASHGSYRAPLSHSLSISIRTARFIRAMAIGTLLLQLISILLSLFH